MWYLFLNVLRFGIRGWSALDGAKEVQHETLEGGGVRKGENGSIDYYRGGRSGQTDETEGTIYNTIHDQVSSPNQVQFKFQHFKLDDFANTLKKQSGKRGQFSYLTPCMGFFFSGDLGDLINLSLG